MPIPLIHDHDGHVDDILSAILLWLEPSIDLQVIGVTNGDCYADQAFEAMLKIATYLGLEGCEVAYTEDPMPNAFPENWRRESYIINELPLFNDNYLKKPYQQGKGRRSEAVYADYLTHSKIPTTIVTTGPLTTISKVLKENPNLKQGIHEIVIMGGAVTVDGNVEDSGHDGSAEWNIFADPAAFKHILEAGVPIKMIPLDVTNTMPVTPEFLQKLESQSDKAKASVLATKLLSLVRGFEYYFWDTVTAVAAIRPDIFVFKEMKIDVSVSGKNQGRTATSMFGGRKIQVATSADKITFEAVVLEILRMK